MLASVQREQDDLTAARRERERQEQSQQQPQGQQQQLQIQPRLLLPQPQPQQVVPLDLDPARLAKWRASKGPLLLAMIQEHTRRGLT